MRLGEAVEGFAVRDGRVASVTVAGRPVVADHYVAALPVEVMRTLLSPELRALEPRLNGLDRLVTRWMNGILFYLADDLPLVRGHAIYLDSEWALTSISQRQFWRGIDWAAWGIGGVLSIDISEWQRAGSRFGKVAALCTPEEIREEVWGSSATTSRARWTASRCGHGPRRGDRVPEPRRASRTSGEVEPAGVVARVLPAAGRRAR